MRKKTANYLKTIRLLLAVILFTPALLLFIDFADLLPDALARLLHIQIIPAFLGRGGILLVFYFFLTLFFGRFYCSMICPAGILQDIINRLACIGKKKRNGTMRFHYHKPANWLRYSILSATTLAAVFGMMELCLLLDPYSNFGRIATNLFRPIVIWINNLLSGFLSSRGNYSLYYVTIDISTAAILSAITAFIVFAVMVYFRGRLFCNTICPVGALLSLISRYSFFKVVIDPCACNGCKSCEHACKAEAIDTQHKKVDMSRCVACYNCLSSCNKNVIGYKLGKWEKWEKWEKSGKSGDFFASRRSFIATSAMVAGSAPVCVLAHKGNVAGNKTPVTPPGSSGLDRYKQICTGCHLCVVQCPSHVLKPAGLQFGLGYLLKPYMSYENSFCNYACTVCSEVCPTHAIKPISVEQKKVTQVGIANFYIDKCIVKTEENDCGACSEHCPTQAVHMIPYKSTLTIPKIEQELCIGCGGCESICPVRPVRAITVVANKFHQITELPANEEVRKVDLDDFGF